MELQRRSGILLHPTSLPGTPGIGTIGSQARAFVDWLEAAHQTLWQILPLATGILPRHHCLPLQATRC